MQYQKISHQNIATATLVYKGSHDRCDVSQCGSVLCNGRPYWYFADIQYPSKKCQKYRTPSVVWK